MAILSEISTYLGDLLCIKTTGDYPQALNGLHLENDGNVTRIAAAVDACEAVLVEATKREVDLLLVHHGLFWNTAPFTGGMYRKMKAAIQGNLAVYSAHLPLDVHPLYGNNALLANAIDLINLQPFFPSKGQPVGLIGQCTVSRSALLQKLASVLGSPVHLCPGGPEFPKCVGVITGGAGSEVAKVAAAGVDTFITGEGPHWSYTLAEELGVNLFYGGHYATETLGVKALASHLSEHFDLPWEYIPHPTGL
ncbi:MAG: Nif3-like dinuclear metal center hexameric protein [Verrucomicrobiota bacterium]